jgi:hypothetical protein
MINAVVFLYIYGRYTLYIFVKYLFCITFGLLVQSTLQSVSAQVDYRPGYVVTQPGDTVRGFIDYRNWERSPEKISFRETAGGVDRLYAPLDLRAFSVAGDQYQSAILQIETSPSTLATLTDTSAPILEADTAFIRMLVGGEKSLYYHHPAGVKGKKLFYIWDNGQWELLVYKNYRQVNGEVVSVATNNRYISQLAFYLQGCPAIQKAMENVRYQEKSLERLFQAYYACTVTKPVFEEKVDQRPWEIGVLVGGTRTSLEFVTDAPTYFPLVQISFPRDFSFTGGLFVDLVRQRNHRRWSLYNELVYTSYKTEGTFYARNTNEENYERTRYVLEYGYLKVNTMIRFKYLIGNVYIFANAGMSSGTMLKEKDQAIFESRFPGTSRTEVAEAIVGENKYEPGYLGGVGVRYQRCSFETRYERTTGMLAYNGLKSRVSKVAFLLSFRLTKAQPKT